MQLGVQGNWGPGAQISQKRSSTFFWNICRASASKRIIANQLEHKVDWTLKFHFLYRRGALLKTPNNEVENTNNENFDSPHPATLKIVTGINV